MTTPINPPRRRQRGKAIHWTDREMDTLSVITPDYVDQVREVWERDAPQDVKALPDTTVTTEGKP